MASVFTEHLLDFRHDSDSAAKVLPALERLLRRRMEKRNLLPAPPSYLGYDPKSWDQAGAFEDITVDCYVFAVLKRRASLQAQLKNRDNIDGLIVRNVDNFLLERQRHYDSVGYAVYGNVVAVVKQAESAAQLIAERNHGGKLHSGSVLRLDPAKPGSQPADPETLQEALNQAADWEEVVATLVKTTDAGQEWVSRFIEGLRAAGVTVRLGDLVRVLAVRTRSSWIARHADAQTGLEYEGGDELANLVRVVWPDRSAENREQWERLKREVPLRIDKLDRQQRVRARLAKEFTALLQLINEGQTPKQADLVDELGIPRATLSDDFAILKSIIEEIQREKNPDI